MLTTATKLSGLLFLQLLLEVTGKFEIRIIRDLAKAALKSYYSFPQTVTYIMHYPSRLYVDLRHVGKLGSSNNSEGCIPLV